MPLVVSFLSENRAPFFLGCISECVKHELVILCANFDIEITGARLRKWRKTRR